MPLPRVVARMNKRYTNRFIEPFVRRMPGFAVVENVGRRSGAHFRTPVHTFDRDGSLLIALTYGPSADWVQNVERSGGHVHRDGMRLQIASVSFVAREAAWPWLPWFVRLALRALRVHDFLLIESTEQRAQLRGWTP